MESQQKNEELMKSRKRKNISKIDDKEVTAIISSIVQQET
jgi:hypothetical protein